MKLHNLMPLLLLGAAAPAASQGAAEGQTIVVTGTSLAETERRLRECLARACPPQEDIDATLAHAENLFVAGDYAKARRVARRSIGRNDRHAKAYPIDVSDLYRAYSRINAHLGEGERYRIATYDVRRILKNALPEDDPRVLGSVFDIAAMHASMNDLDSAQGAYEEIEKKAAKLGRPDLAANARVRAAWLHELSGRRDLARSSLREIAAGAEAGSETRLAGLTALILLARLDRRGGKTASSDALIADLKGKMGPRPVLLFAPRINLDRGINLKNLGSSTRLLPMDNYRDRWVDIGFWVTPEGRVAEAEVLRAGSSYEHWVKPVLRSIEGRIYSRPAAPLGTYRVERYTYTALWMDPSGSRIRQRSPQSRIEFLDLTAEPQIATR